MKNSKQFRAHATAAALCLGGTVLYLFPPAEHTFYPRCIFHALTGMQCPGCGGTRALHALLHLRLAEALHYNALVTVLAPLVLAWFIAWYKDTVFKGHAPGLHLSRPVMVCLYLVVLIFGIARNIPIFS